MEHDLHHKIKAVLIITKQAVGFAPLTSGVIDTKGFESFEYVLFFDKIESTHDGTYDFVYEEDDDIGFGSVTTVPAEEILGDTTPITLVVDDVDVVRRVGNVGKKRFQRLRLLMPTGAGIGSHLTVNAILGDAHINPVAEQ